MGSHRQPDNLGSPSTLIADIAVVDDDEALRTQLGILFNSIGLRTLLLSCPDDAVDDTWPASVRCLVMDVRMRGANGLDLQDRLHGLGIRTPVVFITAHGDIPMSVRAMKAGAVDFLTKPLREQDVLDAVAIALERDRLQRQQMLGLWTLQTRLAALSSRECQVLHLVVGGLVNKQIAAELGLSEVTVKMHRGSMMRKMGVRTAAELTRLAIALDLTIQGPAKHHTQDLPVSVSPKSKIIASEAPASGVAPGAPERYVI